jgi:hypothetical protein
MDNKKMSCRGAFVDLKHLYSGGFETLTVLAPGASVGRAKPLHQGDMIVV